MSRRTVQQLAAIAGAATIVAVVFVLIDLSTTKGTLGGLIGQAPTSRYQLLDYAEIDSPPDATQGPHDGRFFYAIARSFPDLRSSTVHLDEPNYRVQRILFPAVSRALHPVGVGSGLIWTMFAVGVVGVFLAGFSTGYLSTLLGGKAWAAAVPPLYYGSWVSLRITVPDPLALGLGLSAVACTMRGRLRYAIPLAIAAGLTRETAVLLPLGYLLWRRNREAAVVAGAAGGAVALWGVAIRLMAFPAGTGLGAVTFTPPLVGMADAFRFWGKGFEPLGAISLLPAIGLAVVALVRRGLRHPMCFMLLLHLTFMLFYSVDILGPERNASRVGLPILCLALVALLTPKPPARADTGGSGGSFGSRKPVDAPLR